MTHHHFITGDGFGDEDRQERFMPLRMSLHDNDLWAYTQLSNHDHNVLQDFSYSSIDLPFTHESTCANPFTRGAPVFPTPASQFSQLIQYGTINPIAVPRFLPHTQTSMQTIESFYGTLAPPTVATQAMYQTLSQPVYYDVEYDTASLPYPPDLDSPTIASSSTSLASSPEQYDPPLTWPQCMMLATSEDMAVTTGEDFGEDEGLHDKPYAQLIYQALMQAPGHRMLLRDIYEWFIQNTKKPKESGTNGWQNSIRHNLSMNQAFENDKNDPAANRGARKANSVWVLTEDALRHGVQSTTRYRKNNMSKRGVGNKTPAIQRQRSGARGGRAARRAAQLKRSEQDSRKIPTSQPKHEGSPPFSFNSNAMSPSRDEWSVYSTCSPTTPAADQFLSPYSLPFRFQSNGVEEELIKHEADTFLVDDDQLRQILCHEEPEHGSGGLVRF